MVLKPSEVAPSNAIILAEIIERAGVPAGAFNLIHGSRAGVGAVPAGHPGVDMVSFTGSSRAGILVAREAAATVKRVTQELGGKSPNIILDDAGFADAVSKVWRAASSIRVNPAARPRACWCLRAGMRRRWCWRRQRRRRYWSAIRVIPQPSSVRWRAPRNGAKCNA